MRLIAFVLLVVVMTACAREAAPPAQATQSAQSAPEAQRERDAQRAPRARIVFLGDSLTAGLGLPADQSYPSLIGKRLQERGLDFEIVNAGVSGDTTAGGARRLDWSLEGDVKVLIVALGGNDGLRGLPPAEMRKNLAAILDRATARKIPVILAGMEAPPNNGTDYADAFRRVYVDLARSYNVRLIPFLLQGVAGEASLNQADGIHPNARGAAIVADLVWKELEAVLPRPTTTNR